MNKLPQVFLVLTALGLGIMYGHYNYSLDKGLIPGNRSFARHVGQTIRNFQRELAGKGEKVEKPTAQKEERKDKPTADFGEGPTSEKPPDSVKWTWEKEKDTLPGLGKSKPGAPEVPVVPQKRFPKKSELDKIDLLIEQAASYLRIAMLDVELRGRYANMTLDVTKEALDSIDTLIRECGRLPEIQERLQTVTKQRHDATKIAPVGK